MTQPSEQYAWPFWRKVGFRFAFIYLVLYTTPWSLAEAIPGVSYISNFYNIGWDALVRWSNTHYFNIAEELVPLNGSGDTSFAWAALCLGLTISVIGCAVWSVLDASRKNYVVLDYWLRLTVRYYVSFFCFVYGIIKLFAIQMVFPSLSQLATPLGDLLPMRLSWLFIGYSTPYQIFSGVMETVAGLLLLNRKTVTLGLLTATAVFVNVVILNLSYDIPVKLFSIHLLLFSVFLLSYEIPRLVNFFVLNRVSDPNTSFNIELNRRWMRYARIAAKITFIVVAILMPFYNTYERQKAYHARAEMKPVRSGLYDVDLFVLNRKDTIPALVTDSLRWNDIVFDRGGGGSVRSADPMFNQRYRRGYFSYKPDTVKGVIELRYSPTDSLAFMTMKYRIPDEKTIQLWTKYKSDSLYLQLKRSNRHFQLTERQFHWLSEANR